ncbi:MAG: hypothetical protein ACTHMC_12925 [Pseudobacter sp.]|uniref:hypothetical protein n=1 Tax=Pseudobacter sp. TaxID=2045420 RepID=UPI003F80B57F
MALNINDAFREFQASYTNIDPTQNKTAKSSRQWLLEQVNGFVDDDDFLPLHLAFNQQYGSFDRKVKIPPLDDIDHMIGLNGAGCHYDSTQPWNNLPVYVNNSPLLRQLCHEDTNRLNSRKVINRFVSKLSDVPQYEKANINRNAEACTLKLQSYTWNFDIVPCFQTVADSFGKTWYLIPNGYGEWMMTDPRIDRKRVADLNQKHSGHLLPVLRLSKYWQRRKTMPAMQSYLFETMCLDYFAKLPTSIQQWPDRVIPGLFNYISQAVYQIILDPKGLKTDLNNLSMSDKYAISIKAAADYQIALQAIEMENNHDHEGCIGAWGKIFGPEFPKYI